MSRERIDHLKDIDLSTVTCEQLRWMYGTGVDQVTGQGRQKKHTYRNGAMTLLGDIEESIWSAAMEYVAERDGEGWLVDALTEWEKQFGYAKTPKDQRCEALVKYSMRLFDREKWVDYIPFNEKYRPSVLSQKHV